MVDGVTHNYLWQGDRLVSEQYGTTELEFFYDESGVPYALDYNGTIYYYITNLQGDVIGIVDASSTIKAKYKYNAWGEDIDTTAAVSNIETINPLRYRGYYYDSETGLYYLQSRYYDPVVCRFINADDFPSTGQSFLGFNMFAYCCNNPISMTDSEGELGVLAAVAITAGIVGFVVSAASTALENLATGHNVMDGVISSGLGGATYNVVSVFTGNPIAAGYASALVESASGEIINYAAGKKEPTPENLKESAGSVLGETLIKGTAYAFTGKMADKFLPIDFGEMVTKSVLKSDLFKIAEQTVIQSAEYLLGKGIYKNFTSFGMAQ